MTRRVYNQSWAGEYLNKIAFPLGGIGAGMVALEGGGQLSHVSVRHDPDLYNEPFMYSAVCVRGKPNQTRVLEGPVPMWKTFFPWRTGHRGKTYGLPRFSKAEFSARFPFATVNLADRKFPLQVQLTGWSPFIPGDSYNSSLPAAAVEYRFVNTSGRTLEAVYSFHSSQWLRDSQISADHVDRGVNGFVLVQDGEESRPWLKAAFMAAVDSPDVVVNCRWFRGGWFDAPTMSWKTAVSGQVHQAEPYTQGASSPGGSLFVPLTLRSGQEAVIRLRLSWHVPQSRHRIGKSSLDGIASENGGAELKDQQRYCPWYAGQFDDIAAVDNYWRENYTALRERSAAFRDAFFDTSLPGEVVEAVAANLTILKSPTVLRQSDGRIWAWEGSGDQQGCCPGSCTHVWNYAQAMCHLFPDLERTLRQTEFNENQDDRGQQTFRAALPIRPMAPVWFAAADGQLGGIMKVYREWRISGDDAWLREYWPKVKRSLDYCIETWDPSHAGVLVEPHHNTYDIQFWGADGMCTSFYLGALASAIRMGGALGEDMSFYETLLAEGKRRMDEELFDGEYYFQRVQWTGLRAKLFTADGDPGAWTPDCSPEAMALLKTEGPKYQYGQGCMSDGVLGEWMARTCGVGEVIDPERVASHLLAVYRYNFRKDLSTHANPQRPTYALGKEAGLLLCSWPKSPEPSLPFVYSNEVWTGIEYQVASHLMMIGRVEEGLSIVQAVRDRYDGRWRNPFNEYECGNWYARAMSSYALIQGLTGLQYDAVDKTLTIAPSRAGDFRAFLCTAGGFGTAGIKDGQPFLEVRGGKIEIGRIRYLKPNSSFSR